MLDPIHLLTADSSLSLLWMGLACLTICPDVRVPKMKFILLLVLTQILVCGAAQVPPSNPIWAMRIFANHKEKFNLLGMGREGG